jgi:iron complex outermembrane receptor protein
MSSKPVVSPALKAVRSHFFASVSLAVCFNAAWYSASAAQEAGDAVELPDVVVNTPAPAKPKPAKKAAKSSKKPTAAKAAVAGASKGSAQDVQPPDGEANNGRSDGKTSAGLNLSKPSTSGSRLGLTPLETPASVEVISGETVRERGQTSVIDAVTQNAAGFTASPSPGNGGTSLSTRGFSGHGSVMQLYDGTRMYVGSGTVTFPFSTWTAERIEVLRGPASVLYGEGAIGGVVNVIPKKPTDYFVNEAAITLGTDGMRRVGLGSGGPVSDRLSYRLDVEGLQSDGWLDQEGEYGQLALSGSVKLKATPELTFTLSNDYGYQDPLRYFSTPFINGRLDRRLRFTNFNVADSDVNYRDNWTQFKTEWKPNEAFTLRNTAYRLTSHRHWRDAESYAYNSGTGMIDRSSYLEIYHDQEQIGDRFDATVRHDLFGMKNEVVAGFDVNRINFLHTNNSPYGGHSSVDPFDFDSGWFDYPDDGPLEDTRPGFKSKTFQYSLFMEDRLEVTDQLSLVGGLRFERPTIERVDLRGDPDGSFEKDFSTLTWRAGAVYMLRPGLAVYGQYATGIDPLGSLITLSSSQVPFDLATGRQIEVGVKQSFWRGRGEWTLAAYDIVKKKLLTQDPANPGGDPIQVGQQSSRGVELSLALQLAENLRAEGNIAVLEAQYDDFMSGGNSYAGHVPTNVPEQVANLWLKWGFAPRWEAIAGVRWVGETFNDFANLNSRPDYFVVNAGLDYAVTDNSTLSLRGFNLLDEVYATSGSANGDGTTRAWRLAPPRSAELSYRIKF